MTDERDDDEEAGASAADPDGTADAGAENGEGEEEPEPSTDGFQDGDFIRIAYTARTVENDQLVDTTDPDVAEEEGVDEQREFGPRVIVLGGGHIFDAVERDIEGRSAGDTGTVVVPAEEAFGEYDPEQVRTVSADKIPEDDRHPGAQVTVDGQQGFLETIIGGRARVDFNHPLAGEDVEYEYELIEAVEDLEERARGLLGMFLDAEPELWFETDEVEEEQLVEPDEEPEGEEADDAAGAEGERDGAEEPPEPEYETVTVEKETLYIEAPPQLSFDQQWLFQKRQIAQQLMERLGVDRVVIQETIDGSGMGMGMGGAMGGMGGAGAGAGDVEEALEDADVDADEIIEELEADLDVEE